MCLSIMNHVFVFTFWLKNKTETCLIITENNKGWLVLTVELTLFMLSVVNL